MLQSEIEILKNLNHQRIVKYYGSQIFSEGRFEAICIFSYFMNVSKFIIYLGIYIFLEYMPGVSLKALKN